VGFTDGTKADQNAESITGTGFHRWYRRGTNWLYIDETEAESWYENEANRDDTYVLAPGQSGKGQTVETCMKGIGVESGSQEEKVQELEKVQRICLYNIEPRDDFYDPYLRMPFNWKWKSWSWLDPPDNWEIPPRPSQYFDRYTAWGSHVLLFNLSAFSQEMEQCTGVRSVNFQPSL